MTTIHVAEYQDEQGTYCAVWQDDEAGTVYQSLEDAAWAIVADSVKTGENYSVTVHVAEGDEGEREYARFTRAQAEARRYWNRLQRIASAPRDKRTGRALFVSY